jgi:branched-chain amino acid transport system permease protein
MKDVIQFALLGLGSGTLIAGLALALVMTYRGAGVLNLGTGAIAMLGAYVYFDVRTRGSLFLPPIPFVGKAIDVGHPWGPVPAFALALAICGLTGALLDGLVFQRLRDSSALAKLVASLGLLLTLQAIVVLRFGSDGQAAPAVLPSDGSLNVFGVPIPTNRFELFGIVAVVTVVLVVVYRFTRFGLATRAAQENEGMAMLSGLSPATISMTNTVASAMLAGTVGILVAPIAQLDPFVLAFSVIPALAAALIGRFTSFGVAATAGVCMGMIASLVDWVQSLSWFPSSNGIPLPGVANLLFFLIIVAVMFWRGHALPRRGALREPRFPIAPQARRVLTPAIALAVIGVVALVEFPFDYRQALVNSLIGVLMCLALVVLTGFVGQMSLAQVALAGVTALVVSKLAGGSGIGFPIAPLLGIAAALVLGLAMAASAMRVRGANLAIVTMAGAIAVQSFWFANPSFGINPLGASVPQPKLLGVDLGTNADFFVGGSGRPSPVFGFLCLAVAAACALAVAALRRSGLGQRMLAVRSNESAAAAAGIDVRETKLVAYGLSSLIAGTAGALYAYNFGSVDAGRFDISITLAFVAFAYLGGITTVSGAIVGGLMVTGGLVPQVTQDVFNMPSSYELIFGGLLLILTVVSFPDGIAGSFWKLVHHRRRRRAATRAAAPGGRLEVDESAGMVRS